MTGQITVSVDPDVAAVYRSASERERRRFNLLVNLCLRDATGPRRGLQETMSDISRNARSRGLNPEILQAILDDE